MSEQPADEPPAISWFVRCRVPLRRGMFVLLLLAVPPILAVAFSWSYQASGSNELTSLSTCIWGLGSLAAVLAIWLSCRCGIWRSPSGACRVLIYLLAFAYGRMLFDAAQDLLRGYPGTVTLHGQEFRTQTDLLSLLPGGEFRDYARPAIDLPGLLIKLLILTPITKLVRCNLVGADSNCRRSGGFTTRGLLGYTASVALALVWMRYLVSSYAPTTLFHGMSLAEVVVERVGSWAAFACCWCLAAVAQLYGFSKGWRTSLVGFLASVVLNIAGCFWVVWIGKAFGYSFDSNVMAGPPLNAMAMLLGRSVTLWLALATAKLLGVWPVFAAKHQAAAE